eukprot:3774026-Amphidinium_carterae.2
MHRDNILLAMAEEDNVHHNSWMWLSRAQFEQHRTTGTIPGSRASRKVVGTMSTSIRGYTMPEHAVTPSIWQSTQGGTCNQAATTTIQNCQYTCCADDRQCPTVLVSRTIGHSLTAVSTIDELKTFQLSSIRSTMVQHRVTSTSNN